MSVFKSALACVLLLTLAPWATAQDKPIAAAAAEETAGSNQTVAYRQTTQAQEESEGATAYVSDMPNEISYGEEETNQADDEGGDPSYVAQTYPAGGQAYPGSAQQGYGGYAPQGWPSGPGGCAPGGYGPSQQPQGPYYGEGGCPDEMGPQPYYYGPRHPELFGWLQSFRCGTGRYVGGWYGSVEALVLSRTKGTANIPVALDSSNNFNVVLSTHSADFGTVTVPSYLLGYDFSYHTAFEVSYFGVADMHASATALGDGTGNLSFPGGLGSTGADFTFSNQVTMNYNSRFSNAEFNVIKKHGCWNWLWGFRYIRLNEALTLDTLGTDGTGGQYAINTRNNMFGGQLGLRWAINKGRFSFQSTIKGALLGNCTQQFNNIFDESGAITIRPDTLRDGGNLAFASDVLVSGTYQLTEHIFLKLGGQLTYVNGLVLAANQIDYTVFATNSGMGLGHGGNVLFGGGSGGFELRW